MGELKLKNIRGSRYVNLGRVSGRLTNLHCKSACRRSRRQHLYKTKAIKLRLAQNTEIDHRLVSKSPVDYVPTCERSAVTAMRHIIGQYEKIQNSSGITFNSKSPQGPVSMITVLLLPLLPRESCRCLPEAQPLSNHRVSLVTLAQLQNPTSCEWRDSFLG